MDWRSRAPAWAFVALVLAAFLPLCFFGEKIAVNQGYGFDGAFFGPLAFDIPGALGGLSLYRLQRLLPPLLVHSGLVALGLPPTHQRVVAGFVVLAALCVVLAALAWARIAARLQLSPAALWLGGIGLFANFATLKMLSYYPVLVDGPAFALGLLALWLWLERRAVALALLATLSAFVFPTAVLSCLPLLVFPAEPTLAVATGGPARSSPGRVAALFAVAALTVAAFDPGPWPLMLRPRDAATFALSALLAAAWVFFGVRPLAAALDLDALPALLRRNFGGLALAAVPFLLVAASPALATAPNEYPLDFGHVAPKLAARALWFPGGFAVGHVLYFGPIVALAISRWPAVARAAAASGAGLPCLLALVVLTALNSESRHHVFVLPFVVALTAKVLDREGLAWGRVAAFGLVSLLVSRVWVPLGASPGPSYWMNFGPWWSWRTYRACLAIVAPAAFAALGLLRSAPAPRAAASA